jgi:hypothetical protein
MPTTQTKRPKRRRWTPPVITCLEARPEVTAYSGDSWPTR